METQLRLDFARVLRFGSTVLMPSPTPHTQRPAVVRHVGNGGKLKTVRDCAYYLVFWHSDETPRELLRHCRADGISGLDLAGLRKRLSDLKKDGCIERGRKRRCRVTRAWVWTWKIRQRRG